MSHELDTLLEVSPPAPPCGDSPVAPPGIGGWLVLPAIGLILNPVVWIFSLIFTAGEFSNVPSRLESWVMLMMAAETMVMLYFLFAARRFFRKKRNTPAVMIGGIALRFFVYTFLVLAAAIGDESNIAVFNMVEAGKSLIPAAIWIPYFIVSDRVKRTFVVP